MPPGQSRSSVSDAPAAAAKVSQRQQHVSNTRSPTPAAVPPDRPICSRARAHGHHHASEALPSGVSSRCAEKISSKTTSAAPHRLAWPRRGRSFAGHRSRGTRGLIAPTRPPCPPRVRVGEEAEAGAHAYRLPGSRRLSSRHRLEAEGPRPISHDSRPLPTRVRDPAREQARR